MTILDSKRSAWGIALLGGVLAASPALAQTGVLTRGTGDALFCNFDLDRNACSTSDGCEGEAVCRELADDRRCFEPDAIFCCHTDADCPHGLAGDTDALTCASVGDVDLGGNLCLPADRTYCSEVPDGEQVLACHTTPAGARTRRWVAGDCDRDGIANGIEDEISTNPCAAPSPLGAFDGEACLPLDTGCALDTSCTNNVGSEGTCEATGDGAGTFCEPDDETLFCCGEVFACPDESRCVSAGGGMHVCVPDACLASDSIDPLACVRNADGGLVPFARGDCDGDGVDNESEDEADTDPCVAEPVPADAGTPADGGAAADAGAPAPDAGDPSRADAGSAGQHDGGAGVPIQPRFEGGGGCACRAAPSAPAPAGGLAVLLLALALAWWRR